MTQCRGYECGSTDLINAHIIGRGFARRIMGNRKHNVKASFDQAEHTQHGVFDSQILCARCDGILGKYDDYAIKVCDRFKSEHKPGPEGSFVLEDVDGDCFAKFVLSVLWRASISNRPECRNVKLGRYENEARDVLFGAKTLADLKSYRLYVARYQSTQHDPCSFYTYPESSGVNEPERWGFGLNGFRILASFAQHPDPSDMDRYVVNGSDRLIGPFVPLEGMTEYADTQKMGANQCARDLERSKR